MRIGIALLAALVGTGSAIAQAGGSHGSAGMSGGGHISGGSAGARGMAGGGQGVRPGPGIRSNGPVPRLSPSMSPNRPVTSGGLGTRSNGAGQLGYGQGVNGQNDRVGNWTSSGFVPGPYGQPQYGREGNGHVGYGYGGYPAYGFGLGYYGGLGLDDYDPNDPNSQAHPQDVVAPNQQDYGQREAGQGNGQQQYPGGYGPGPQDAAAAGWGDAGPGPRAAYRSGNGAGQDTESAAVSSGVSARSDGLTHPRVTLIFKDGRKPLTVQNYAMTQSKIFVRDQGAEQDVPIRDLDVAATMAANDRAGVDFALPVKN